MKLTKKSLRQIIAEERQYLEEYGHVRGNYGSARGNMYSNVTPMSAKRILDQLKTQGRNRSLTRGDEMDAQRFINDNISSWNTSRDVKDAIIGYLVSKRFGNKVDYR
jgi:hypothetical protein